MSAEGIRHRDGSPCHCGVHRLLCGRGEIESDYLFAYGDEVNINNAGRTYRLRAAENGNLVLDESERKE